MISDFPTAMHGMDIERSSSSRSLDQGQLARRPELALGAAPGNGGLTPGTIIAYLHTQVGACLELSLRSRSELPSAE